jgi:hypothetical protein
MLNPEWFDDNLEDLNVLLAELQPASIKPIARAVTRYIETGDLEDLVLRLKDPLERARMFYEYDSEIYIAVGEITRLAEAEIRKLFNKAGVAAVEEDNRIFKAAGEKPISLSSSPKMVKMLQTAATRTITGGDDARARSLSLRNITGTTAINAGKLFYNTLNNAAASVLTGGATVQEALNDAMKQMAREGITFFHYASGRNLRPETAVLLNLRTTVSQVTGELTEEAMRERGASYVEVSLHNGARVTNKNDFTNHSWWQGKVYHWKELEDDFNKSRLTNERASGKIGDTDGKTRIDNVREIDFNDTAVVKREIQAFLDKYSDTAVEHAIVITKSGKIYELTGAGSTVNTEMIGSEELAGSIGAHNHPIWEGFDRGDSFSYDDLLITVNHKTGIEYLTSGKRRDAFEYTGNLSEDEVYEAYIEAKYRVMDMSFNGELDTDWEKAEIMRELSKTLKGLTYHENI